MNSPQPSSSLLTVSCRYVPYDQWLITHFDPSWKIKQVKLWILAKCITSQLRDVPEIIPQRYRPASPITFAPHPRDRPISPIRFAIPPVERPRPSLDSTVSNWDDDDDDDGDGDNDNGWDPEFDLDYESNSRWSSRRYHPSPSSAQKLPSAGSTPSSQPQPSNEPTEPSSSDLQFLMQYTLIRFATGQILEDDFPLSWYSVRPYELLEVHRAGVILRLPRELPYEYVEPYFEARVKVLRVVSGNGYVYAYGGDVDEEWKAMYLQGEADKEKEKERGKKSKSKDKEGKGDSFVMVERGRSKKLKVEWKPRWVVIRSGVLRLCKDENDYTPQGFPLSLLVSLRGPEHLADARLLPPTPHRHILCAKFRSPPATTVSKDAEKEKKEKGIWGNRGKDTPARVTRSSDVNIRIYNEDRDVTPTTAANQASPSPARLRPKSFEVEGEKGLDAREEKGQSKSQPGSAHPANVKSTQGSAVASPTTGSFNAIGTVRERDKKGRERETGEGYEDGNEGELIILDMLDDNAYTNILRILHRHFPPPMSSSFVPPFSSRPISTPANTPIASPLSLSPSSSHIYFEDTRKQSHKGKENESKSETENGIERPDTTEGQKRGQNYRSNLRLSIPPTFGALPYPEWRTEIVGRAQRASIGDVSRALSLVLCGDWEGVSIPHDTESSSEAKAGGRDHVVSDDRMFEGDTDDKRSGSVTPLGSADGGEVNLSEGEDDDVGEYSDGSSEKSEAEWEGWMGDLERQGRVNAVLEREGWGAQGRARTATRGSGEGQLSHEHASSQRLFQQGRRALEPSAVVTPLFNSLHQSGNTPSTSSISGSISSLGLQTGSPEGQLSGVSTDSSMAGGSGRKNEASSIGYYGKSSKMNLSINDFLRSGSGPTSSSIAVGGDPTGGVVGSARKVSASSPSSSRKRSATVASPNHSPTTSAVNGGFGAVFPKRKGKERWEDDGGEPTRGDERPKLSLAFSSVSPSGPLPNSFLVPQQGSPTVSSATMPPRSRQSILRHVRSGSSLYGGCVGPTSLDVGEDIITPIIVAEGAEAGGTRKASSKGLVRGVSARAGKFAKGLDAALDFVDAR